MRDILSQPGSTSFRAAPPSAPNAEFALRKRTPHPRSAPKPLTGCVSNISTCVPIRHSYTDALKKYAAVYAAYQAYLTPVQPQPCREGRVALAQTQGMSGGGEVDMEEVMSTVVFTDDEVESCGYLGWLHR